MFAPVTRVELEAALEPIRAELAAMRRDIEKLFGDIEKLYGVIRKICGDIRKLDRDVEKLYGDVGGLREHCATKADVEAMGRRIVMWVGGLLAVFVAVIGWLVGRT